jgi:predicted acyltransferase
MSATLTPPPTKARIDDTAPAAVSRTIRAPRERLLSLDVFRGITVAGMLLVNDPGTWSAIYPPLEHAEWFGWTPTDLIFPFFLFIVGITTQLSMTARRARGDDEHAIRAQILRRGALIFLFGFLLNGFPFFTWGDVVGVAHPSFGLRVVDRLLHWRIMGVLQRIGLAYLVSALIATRTTVKTQVLVTACILFAYWIVMTVLPVPGTGGTPGALLLASPETNMAAYWDRVFLDWSRFGLGNHIWVNGVTWDPEGVLSTAGAICTAMLGNLAGRWIGQARPLMERVCGLFAAGAIGMMAGLMWHWSFPMGKNLWTSSFVFFTGGMACVSLATVMWLVDIQQWRSWTRPFVIYGMNPMIAFIGSGLMARCIYSIFKATYHGQTMSLQAAIYQSLFASWLAPVNASLAFAICFVLFWYAVLAVLHRRNIILKV